MPYGLFHTQLDRRVYRSLFATAITFILSLRFRFCLAFQPLPAVFSALLTLDSAYLSRYINDYGRLALHLPFWQGLLDIFIAFGPAIIIATAISLYIRFSIVFDASQRNSSMDIFSPLDMHLYSFSHMRGLRDDAFADAHFIDGHFLRFQSVWHMPYL